MRGRLSLLIHGCIRHNSASHRRPCGAPSAAATRARGPSCQQYLPHRPPPGLSTAPHINNRIVSNHIEQLKPSQHRFRFDLFYQKPTTCPLPAFSFLPLQELMSGPFFYCIVVAQARPHAAATARPAPSRGPPTHRTHPPTGRPALPADLLPPPPAPKLPSGPFAPIFERPAPRQSLFERPAPRQSLFERPAPRQSL